MFFFFKCTFLTLLISTVRPVFPDYFSVSYGYDLNWTYDIGVHFYLGRDNDSAVAPANGRFSLTSYVLSL